MSLPSTVTSIFGANLTTQPFRIRRVTPSATVRLEVTWILVSFSHVVVFGMAPCTACHSSLSMVTVLSADSGPILKRCFFGWPDESKPEPTPRFIAKLVSPSSWPLKFTRRFCGFITIATTGICSSAGNRIGMNSSSRTASSVFASSACPEATGGRGVHGGSAHSAWSRADWITKRTKWACSPPGPGGRSTERNS